MIGAWHIIGIAPACACAQIALVLRLCGARGLLHPALNEAPVCASALAQPYQKGWHALVRYRRSGISPCPED
ncbi:MAG: hypothetical protein COT38_04810 [Candidatus Omnitrophica bacterium CG08_land_8_20_14_0_20_41_16]|nr:MAG: hypothetical protein COT38_04810 [Candidatus Omnitrophica bacterium CG08_land_8_20_14_0_20_41_16]